MDEDRHAFCALFAYVCLSLLLESPRQVPAEAYKLCKASSGLGRDRSSADAGAADAADSAALNVSVDKKSAKQQLARAVSWNHKRVSVFWSLDKVPSEHRDVTDPAKKRYAVAHICRSYTVAHTQIYSHLRCRAVPILCPGQTQRQEKDWLPNGESELQGTAAARGRTLIGDGAPGMVQ